MEGHSGIIMLLAQLVMQWLELSNVFGFTLIMQTSVYVAFFSNINENGQ